ncbi:MAG TPA: DNA polymerase I [Bacillota bacterium]|nr:DNA polymerase I [Bacillota bacterium]
MSRVYLLDGYSLVFRAFYAMDANLRTKDGRPTNAVRGIAMMLNKLIELESPEFMVASFDLGQPTLRLDLYPEYKAQRDRTPPELAEQVDYIKELITAYGISIFEVRGHEADDVIGTVARAAERMGMDSVVVTSDRDLLQLVNDKTRVMLTRRGVTDVEIMNETAVLAKYGLLPTQLVDLKALMGDPSDNIKGVKGVGEKTAQALLHEFGTLENIYANLDKVGKPRLRALLEEGQESAFLSQKLATIVTDVDLGFVVDSFEPIHTDVPRLRALYRDLEMQALLDKLPGPGEVEATPGAVTVEVTALNAKTAHSVAELLKRAPHIGMALAQDEPGQLYVSDGKRAYSLALEDKLVCSTLAEAVSSAAVAVVRNSKQMEAVLCDGGMTLGADCEDLEIGAYLLDPSSPSYSLVDMVQRYLGLACRSEGEAVIHLPALWGEILRELKEKELYELYREVELPLGRVLLDMERIGFSVDVTVLQEMEADVDRRLADIIADIYEQAGQEFNISSPKQLSTILFDKLNLPVIKKTKTGFSTDAEVLETLAEQHEIVRMILLYRTLTKLKSTYLQGLQKVVGADGKVHTTYNQTVTVTGRLSSTEPNLQNIPIRLEEGRLIRRAFRPTPPYTTLLAADYSQIELRILAHLSGDRLFTEAFVKGEDIHRRTAAEVFGVPLNAVTREMRDRAKAVNFGIVYGISDYGLARDLRVSRGESREYIANYFARYSGVKEYIAASIEKARELGYVTTMLNRRRYLPDINNRNFTLRSFAERTAMNTPIQGTAADLIKLAMVRIHKAIAERGLASRMILQVHDELLFEAMPGELDELKVLVKETMEQALVLSVPLVVDLKVGDNWYNVKPV